MGKVLLMSLDHWDEKYLSIAKEVSNWSKDLSTQVGAVIADANRRIVAVGFNGFPKKVCDSEQRLSDRGKKYPRVVHAEANVALIAGRAARGGTVYVHGAPICSHCAGILIQAGIVRAVARPPCQGTGAKAASTAPKIDWDELGQIALEMFAEADVKFEPSE
jgi:dCMP deaminase